jgi:hypothetical protein
MASLCLANSELHVGVDWDNAKALARVLEDPERDPILLYPGPEAIDVATDLPRRPVSLIVVDGTWSQAKALVRDNAQLRALPRYTFRARSPSEYRIRREPDAAYVSTIEALVHVLGALEGDPERFVPMLAPFRAMVDAQIACATTRGAGRVRHRRAPRPPRPRVPAIVRERWPDLVCVVGEANAWPYRSSERGAGLYPDEIVHWVAHRPATGESFSAIAAPRNPLAPRTASHVQLDESELASGDSLASIRERWRAFVRDGDVLCHWGHYAAALFGESGGFLPATRLDLRQVARAFSGGGVGAIEDFAATLAPLPPPLTRGRAGARAAMLAAIARRFSALSS